ncbi:hypothetical protein K490DRAFT_64968 [Saccharata proteae CBS 121410]|uniref:Uncharacterized protein n=1 Tax=Saccharata proteae CBS 121410 TaxID=1314787 RepID=A0A9P4LY07_9PEZI|nr:hypothetical protein K490DRAFT_64968 [Saccharata proteae CBS 121410]
MSDLDPTGPSQPSLSDAYKTTGNPATKAPTESHAAAFNASAAADSSIPSTDTRVPSEQTSSIDEAMPSSLGRGVRGAGAGEEAKGLGEEDVGRHQELDAQQMAAPGEGRVAGVVEEKPGASGNEPGLETDLDRKKAEQAPAREAMKEQRKQEVDVGGVLGQTGGPANPVDKGGYPNASS